MKNGSNTSDNQINNDHANMHLINQEDANNNINKEREPKGNPPIPLDKSDEESDNVFGGFDVEDVKTNKI